MQRGAIERLVRKVEPAAGFQRPANWTAVGRTGIDASGCDQQHLSRELFELTPELVRAAEERDVCGIFPIGETNDPGQAVRRAEFVRDFELLEPENAKPSPRKVKQSRASHAADAEHDRVE